VNDAVPPCGGRKFFFAIGMEQGIEKASKALALNLLGNGISVATIAEITGLSVPEITSLSQKGGEQG